MLAMTLAVVVIGMMKPPAKVKAAAVLVRSAARKAPRPSISTTTAKVGREQASIMEDAHKVKPEGQPSPVGAPAPVLSLPPPLHLSIPEEEAALEEEEEEEALEVEEVEEEEEAAAEMVEAEVVEPAEKALATMMETSGMITSMARRDDRYVFVSPCGRLHASCLI